MKTLKIFIARLILIVFAASIFIPPVFSGENVEVFFNKEKVFVGDFFEMKLKVELPKDSYISAKQNISFNNFDIENININHISHNPNIYEMIFKLAAYKTGELVLEPEPVFYINPDGTNNLFFTPRAIFNIESVIKDSQKGIKDIKPPSKLSLEPFYFILMILLLLIIGALVFLIYKDISNKSQKEIPLDPKTAALNALDELYKSDMKEIDLRIFYYRMSEILREYISYKYNFNAMEMTTTEFFKAIEKILPQSININEVKQYLNVFNLARYAAFSPDNNENEKNYIFTKMLLEKL
ncbi:MAG: hypothetical protein LBQ37_01485 [Elusimicrobiota bacterium]|jgi:hypothetical protein|nr:hypothetical protein [Elusimicrobiota bacterium]